ncbi:glutaminyl-peptide cyclotransferase [Corynebacterium bovis]|uniref:glutaminyl-peptide cyclotransferase n=1 Tax=Corynebacterium bovis TaxID=36808 RepID=UPI00313942E2
MTPHPFDPTSFTQGLDVAPDGSVVVGTGLTGRSGTARTTRRARRTLRTRRAWTTWTVR